METVSICKLIYRIVATVTTFVIQAKSAPPVNVLLPVRKVYITVQAAALISRLIGFIVVSAEIFVTPVKSVQVANV